MAGLGVPMTPERPRRPRIAAAVLSTVLLACGAPAPDRATDADAPVTRPEPGATPGDTAVAPSFACEGLARTILAVDPTRAGLAARFGPPDSALVSTEPNRHVPGATDSLFTLRYPGIVAGVRVAGGRDFTEHVEVRDARYLAAGAPGIGDAASAVVAALGEPTRRTATSLVYECGEAVEEPVTFHLRDGVVDRIDIGYYVD